jgi:hypothetical protein
MNKGLTAVWLLLIICVVVDSARAQSGNTPSSLLQYNSSKQYTPGDGYMVAGDVWETVKPLNTNDDNLLNNSFRGIGMTSYMHMGSNDVTHNNPGGMWPAGYRVINLFRNARKFGFPVFKSDGWPGYVEGNPIFDIDAGKDSRFMTATYGPNLSGAGDPARDYQREAHYTDATRTHLIYEAGWPSTAGIDFKLRAHQYTPNEQNVNDFVTMEITMTNTGEVDSDADGDLEATGNVIDAVTASLQGETAPAVKISFNGRRLGGTDGGSKFGAGRTFGYVGAPDESGSPYDMLAYFANVPPGRTGGRSVPPPGERDFGINNYTNKDGYTDIWGAWRWMGVKQGSIEDFNDSYANLGAINASSTDKQTLFGTHPIGEGAERGWYTSHTFQPQLVTYRYNDSAKEFRAATAVWYEDYGRAADGGTRPVNLAPNGRFFASGSADDVTTFVPAASPQRPHGDFKYASEDVNKEVGIQQPVWEPGWNPTLAGNGSPSDADFYDAIGYTREWTFGESNKTGVGPFSLDVGESITFVFVAAAGFRFEGVRDAIEAAEWAWERGWDIRSDLPAPPAPEVQVASTVTGTAVVRWTDVQNLDSEVDGYKIWRAAQYRRRDYLEEGMRLVDQFHHQHEVEASTDALLDPINPYFDAADFAFSGSDVAGTYQPEEWGTYDLITKIPVGDLSQYAATGGSYDFEFEDENAIAGFTYWYYVSSYKEGGSWTGPMGPVTVGHLESSGVVNRNGRNSPDAPIATIGLDTPWSGTYPFAYENENYPDEGTLGFKNIGTSFTVTPPVASDDDVARLITVSPNPYKITGLNDVRTNPSSHNLSFLNLPSDYTITIMDVSGQIMLQESVEAASDGRYVWDMFSKDGVEVSSGLYIYHVAYGGREVVGHFAILR